MRALSISSLVILLAVAPLAAATGQVEVMFENEHMRVLKTTLQPHQPAPMQEPGKNRVLIHLDPGQWRQTAPHGKAENAEFQGGGVEWLPGGQAVTRENITGKPFQIVEILWKGAVEPKVEVPELDPLKADPKHYSLVFENEHTRVLRVAFGPHENGVQHTHVRNYLVTYMTPQAKGDRGQVSPHFDEGSRTHVENNPMDWRVERIAVELK
jgi:hypothetical protein